LTASGTTTDCRSLAAVCCQSADFAGLIFADDPDVDVGALGPHVGHDVLDQVQDGGDVGVVAHLAGDDEGGGFAGLVSRGEVVQVHTVGKDRDFGFRISDFRLLIR